MAKTHKQRTGAGSQKPAAKQNKAAQPQKNIAPAKAPASAGATPPVDKSKQGNKNPRPAIGGTAVTGAKSTAPKEIPAKGPAQDRPELYNRDTRRRMQHMGTGPYNEPAPNPARKRFEKRVEERKQRQEEVKKTVVTKGPSTNIKIGNKNTYFMLAVLGIVVLILVIAIIIRHPF
jgi:hypothetical protein